MSSKSSSSSFNTHGIRGFPEKCMCGCESTIYTSKTRENPERPFFRCPTKKEEHLFKWVDETVFEEVEDALPKIGDIESEIGKSKADIEEVKSLIAELKEDVIRTKNEVKRCKFMLRLCVGIICLTIILLAPILANVMIY